jgi:predicted heme/steroid binding protein
MNGTVLNSALKQSASDEMARCAYNGTFWDLGFKWQWDGETYRALCSIGDEKERIRTYIRDHQSHLLQAYDPEFLVNLIHENKARRHDAILAARASGTPVNLNCNGVKGGV